VRWFAGVIAPFAVPRIAEHWGVESGFAIAAICALAAPALLGLFRGNLHRPAAPAAAPGTAPLLAPIIAAVDGSASDVAVLTRAAALAREGRSGVLALHVRMEEIFADEAAELEDEEAAGAIVAASLSRLAAGGVAAEGRVLRAASGGAARLVAETARDVRSPALVVGATHGSDLDNLMHGSFSAALVGLGMPDAEIVVTPAAPAGR
jgi:nucleotide-binding universal stress UspA family protein